jgi:hypothetical protein
MKAFQLKYRGVTNDAGREPILVSRNNPKGRTKFRTRCWNGPRNKLLNGVGKRLARLVFNEEVKRSLV